MDLLVGSRVCRTISSMFSRLIPQEFDPPLIGFVDVLPPNPFGRVSDQLCAGIGDNPVVAGEAFLESALAEHNPDACKPANHPREGLVHKFSCPRMIFTEIMVASGQPHLFEIAAADRWKTYECKSIWLSNLVKGEGMEDVLNPCGVIDTVSHQCL